ncbi:MAG: tyrosine--tRNA ligase [Chlamydiae bacterium]|nr:tyrosine--tRNA ligase [Chlamydiota bacterium]
MRPVSTDTALVLSHLKERGLFQDSTPGLEDHLKEGRYVYAGFDVTADSLHLGNLLVILTLYRFKMMGHKPVILYGGATTKIGDPSGKQSDRPLLSIEQIEHNLRKISSNLEQILGNDLIFVNNSDWFDQMTVPTFLRDIGRFFRVSQMLGKDSVRSRMEAEEGISFCEFSYQLLQGYDFHYLAENHGVTVQIGGSDQWGNMTAGTDLSRRKGGKELHVMTIPLMLRSDGKKFGKSESGAIYLNKDRTSAYAFYQYLLNIPDEDVEICLKRFTFLSLLEIESLTGLERQRRLASELTRFIHGEMGLKEAVRLTEVAFSDQLGSKEDYDQIFDAFPHAKLSIKSSVGKTIMDILLEAGLIPSKSEGVRLISSQGLRINGKIIDDPKSLFQNEELIGGVYLFAQQGKKKKMLISFS